MRNISVSAFIHTLFVLVFSLLLTGLFSFIYWDKERQKKEEINRYKLISNLLISTSQLNPTKSELETFYTSFKVRPVSINETRLLLLRKKNIEKKKKIFQGKSKYGKMVVLPIGNNRYIFLERSGRNEMFAKQGMHTLIFSSQGVNGYTVIFQDKKPIAKRIEMTLLVAILIAILFLFFYIAIVKKLAPLKTLHKEIEEFSQGNMNIKITPKGNDEIGKIAQSFDNALHHIRTLLESKSLFMRNMMHELKTPITRGRIAIEMVEDSSSKNMLIRAFERMNELIAELAHVERLTTQDFHPQMKEAKINDIIEESISLLLCDKHQLIIKTQNESLTTDTTLLALAIKNLLDNALKYSDDEKATITTNFTSIQVSSKGKSLEYPLSYYLEPFTQEEKRNSGFGLGLYIVNNIAERLKYRLSYHYKEGKNIFIIHL